jgi:DNA-binding XRE family transcriptional regulator
MKRKILSPFEGDTWKHIEEDPAFADAFFAELVERPLAVQVAMLRRFRGLSQVELAARLHVTQSFLSKLEKEDSNHLVGLYEKLAKLLNGKLAIVPEGTKLVAAKDLPKAHRKAA